MFIVAYQLVVSPCKLVDSSLMCRKYSFMITNLRQISNDFLFTMHSQKTINCAILSLKSSIVRNDPNAAIRSIECVQKIQTNSYS